MASQTALTKGSLTPPNPPRSPQSSVSSKNSYTSANEGAVYEDPQLAFHLTFIQQQAGSHDELHEVASTPLFTFPIKRHAQNLESDSSPSTFPQYALLGGNVEGLDPYSKKRNPDPRIFQNIAAPSSTFICGSQGSGKSHTLSCILENCLIRSALGELPHPLTGIVFYYDTFNSDSGGTPCEAAYLASNDGVSVRVLCPPTNFRIIKGIYAKIGNVTVETLRLNEFNLNTQRMLDLMAVRESGMPLYVHVILRILRELRINQQSSGTLFNYAEFKRMVEAESLTRDQLVSLHQRLDTLESFMVTDKVTAVRNGKKVKVETKIGLGTDWSPKASQLTIVDLSCPCVTPEMACCLFNMCLSLFLEKDATIGRVIALDEAHKYMGESPECRTLTNSLLSTIRLQRHLGARVIISTQEPTISPKLLDLCNITVVHRFTSPDWIRTLEAHLAGISTKSRAVGEVGGSLDEGNFLTEGVRGLDINTSDPTSEIFSRIVQLKVGEALIFAPSAIMSLQKNNPDGTAGPNEPSIGLKRLGHEVLHVRIRTRLTADGGRSIMAM